MTREEIIQAIAITSGFAGIEEFEYCESIHSMTLFIKWYKNDISFRSKGVKELGEKVISFLNNKMKNNKINNSNNKTNNKMETRNISLTLEEAKEWYNSDNDILEALVLRAFSKEELECSFKNIKSFEDACKVMKLDYNNMFRIADEIASISTASAAMFKLNIIRRALNLGQDLHLTKGSYLYYPCNPFISKLSPFYKYDGSVETIGEVKCEGINYKVINSTPHKCDNAGLTNYSSSYYTANTTAATAFLGCATKEIAKHFGTYFGMLITEAKFGDIHDFTIINSKYNN